MENKHFQCLFDICACEYLQHLELDKSFFISTGTAYYIHFEVHCICYAQDNIILLILNKLISWNLAINL